MPKAQEVKVYEGSGSVNCDRWLHGTVWVILTIQLFSVFKMPDLSGDVFQLI